nr:hypothetical protein BaRGS_014538 [Batillaria attramentaria]
MMAGRKKGCKWKDKLHGLAVKVVQLDTGAGGKTDEEKEREKEERGEKALVSASENRDARASFGEHAMVIMDHLLKDNLVNEVLKLGPREEMLGLTALSMTASLGHVEGSRRLLEAGASVDDKSSDGDNALMVAVRHGDARAINSLWPHRKNLDINNVNNEGCTALHLAAQRKWESCVQFLIQKGADVNRQNTSGQTALHIAAINGDDATAERLIAAGTSLLLEDKNGNTPFCLAAEGEHDYLAGYLLSKLRPEDKHFFCKRRIAKIQSQLASGDYVLPALFFLTSDLSLRDTLHQCDFIGAMVQVLRRRELTRESTIPSCHVCCNLMHNALSVPDERFVQQFLAARGPETILDRLENRGFDQGLSKEVGYGPGQELRVEVYRTLLLLPRVSEVKLELCGKEIKLDRSSTVERFLAFFKTLETQDHEEKVRELLELEEREKSRKERKREKKRQQRIKQKMKARAADGVAEKYGLVGAGAGEGSGGKARLLDALDDIPLTVGPDGVQDVTETAVAAALTPRPGSDPRDSEDEWVMVGGKRTYPLKLRLAGLPADLESRQNKESQQAECRSARSAETLAGSLAHNAHKGSTDDSRAQQSLVQEDDTASSDYRLSQTHASDYASSDNDAELQLLEDCHIMAAGGSQKYSLTEDGMGSRGKGGGGGGVRWADVARYGGPSLHPETLSARASPAAHAEQAHEGQPQQEAETCSRRESYKDEFPPLADKDARNQQEDREDENQLMQTDAAAAATAPCGGLSFGAFGHSDRVMEAFYGRAEAMAQFPGSLVRQSAVASAFASAKTDSSGVDPTVLYEALSEWMWQSALAQGLFASDPQTLANLPVDFLCASSQNASKVAPGPPLNTDCCAESSREKSVENDPFGSHSLFAWKPSTWLNTPANIRQAAMRAAGVLETPRTADFTSWKDLERKEQPYAASLASIVAPVNRYDLKPMPGYAGCNFYDLASKEKLAEQRFDNTKGLPVSERAAVGNPQAYNYDKSKYSNLVDNSSVFQGIYGNIGLLPAGQCLSGERLHVMNEPGAGSQYPDLSTIPERDFSQEMRTRMPKPWLAVGHGRPQRVAAASQERDSDSFMHMFDWTRATGDGPVTGTSEEATRSRMASDVLTSAPSSSDAGPTGRPDSPLVLFPETLRDDDLSEKPRVDVFPSIHDMSECDLFQGVFSNSYFLEQIAIDQIRRRLRAMGGDHLLKNSVLFHDLDYYASLYGVRLRDVLGPQDEPRPSSSETMSSKKNTPRPPSGWRALVKELGSRHTERGSTYQADVPGVDGSDDTGDEPIVNDWPWNSKVAPPRIVSWAEGVEEEGWWQEGAGSRRWRTWLRQILDMPWTMRRQYGKIVLPARSMEFNIGRTGSHPLVLGFLTDGAEVGVLALDRTRHALDTRLMATVAADSKSDVHFVLRYKAVWECAGRVYLAMELCDYTLDEYVGIVRLDHRQDPLSANRLAWQMLKGLKYLHSNFAVPHGNLMVAGMLLHYILTGGCHPYGDSAMEVEGNLRHNSPRPAHVSQEADHLVSAMIMSDPDSRPSIDACLKHPFFWSGEKRFRLVLIVGSDILTEMKTCVPLTGPGSASMVDILNVVHINAVSDNWLGEVDPVVVKEMRAFRQYKNTLPELVLFVYNCCLHFDKMSTVAKEVLDDPCKYFQTKFPALFMAVYRAMRASDRTDRTCYKPFF